MKKFVFNIEKEKFNSLVNEVENVFKLKLENSNSTLRNSGYARLVEGVETQAECFFENFDLSNYNRSMISNIPSNAKEKIEEIIKSL